MQANIHHGVRIATAAAALALCAACGRREPPAPPEPAPAAGEVVPIPALPVPALPVPAQKSPAPQSDEERLFGEMSVWWNIQPTGAVLRIRGTRSDLVVTALTERVETRVATGFYTVEISADGYETWTRRTPLGGTSTNQTVTLFALPPPPPPPPPTAETAPKPSLAPYFPERQVRDLRKALEEDGPKSETPVVEPPSVAVVEPPAPVELPSVAVVEPLAPIAVPQDQRVVEAAPSASSPLLPTRLVRGALESTVPGDTGFFSEPMTLSIGGLVRRIDAAGFALNYADIGNAPITIRVRNYDVSGPAAAPAVSPAGVAHLVYRATPHPVSIRFPDLDPEAVPCNAATGRPVAGYDPATRTLRAVPAHTPLDLVIRRRGHRIQTFRVEPQKPGAKVAFSDVRSLPLPAYGRKGDRHVIDLGDGTGLSLVWVPGGPVEDPSRRGSVVTVPRGFWISEHPVTRRQWRAALGGIVADGAGRPDGDPVSIARTGFGAFAQSLMAAEPRMTVRLPRAAELLLAAKTGLSGVKPATELIQSASGENGRPAGAFHVVVGMQLAPAP